jgi:hypothetical protein
MDNKYIIYSSRNPFFSIGHLQMLKDSIRLAEHFNRDVILLQLYIYQTMFK